MAKTFGIAVTLILIACGADAVHDCYNTLTVNCFAISSLYTQVCNESEVAGNRSVETCPDSLESCYETTVRVTEPGAFVLDVTTGGCILSGVPNECYSREEIAALDSSFESFIDQTEATYGLTVNDVEVCYCSSDLCNEGLTSLPPPGSAAMSSRRSNIPFIIMLMLIVLISSFGDSKM